MRKQISSTFAAAVLAATPLCAQSHEHFAAGIIDANGNNNADPGEKLQFVNGGLIASMYHMLWKPEGQRYGGYYTLDEIPRPAGSEFAGEYFSFIALSDGQFELALPNHATTGAYLWLEITSVAGPSGARFGFWDENASFFNTTPTASFLTNTSTGGYKFVLSEGIDAAGEDPGGHIHNRGWTVDQPGEYTVGFTLYDLSHQGPGGGPIHAPSQTYYFHFQAVPEPSTTMLGVVGVALGLLRRHRRRGSLEGGTRFARGRLSYSMAPR